MTDHCSFPDTEQRLHIKKTTTVMRGEAESGASDIGFLWYIWEKEETSCNLLEASHKQQIAKGSVGESAG